MGQRGSALTIRPLFVCSLIVMGFDWVGPDFVFAALGTIYMITGIISIRDGSAGFANSGVLTVLALYVVAEGVSQTGGKNECATLKAEVVVYCIS